MSVKVIKDKNGVKGVFWSTRVYNSYAEVDQAQRLGKKSKIKITKFYFPGDIFKTYSSYEKFPLFLQNRVKDDFDLKVIENKEICTPVDVENYCENNQYEADESYYNTIKGGKK